MYSFSWNCTASAIFLIHVSVSDLYIPCIGPHISCSRISRSIVGINKSPTDTLMWKFGLWPCNSFSGYICFKLYWFFAVYTNFTPLYPGAYGAAAGWGKNGRPLHSPRSHPAWNLYFEFFFVVAIKALYTLCSFIFTLFLSAATPRAGHSLICGKTNQVEK
jgi:hypothetical protein